MNADVTINPVLPMHLAALTADHPGPDRRAAGAAIEPLFIRASEAADQAGITRISPVGYYPVQDQGVHLVAGFDIGTDEAATGAATLAGLEIIEVPRAQVATLLHVGEMSAISSTYAELGQWATDQGLQGPFTWREVYLEADGTDQSDWLVQVQVEIPPHH